MSQRERGKLKALRIDLQYFRRRTWLDASRSAAIGLALLLGGAYAAWVLWIDRFDAPQSALRASQLSTGPLSQAHASFANDCHKCHATGKIWPAGAALSSHAWHADNDRRIHRLQDACGACHRTLPHAGRLLSDENRDRDCVACHREHRGGNHRLTDISNPVCTSCHASLATACKPGITLRIHQSIADFSTASHGVTAQETGEATGEAINTSSALEFQKDIADRRTFRSLLKDTGRIRFDHAQHLHAGQVEPGSKGGFQSDMLSAEFQSRYAAVERDGKRLVSLVCSDCHQPLATAAPVRGSAVAWSASQYYAPIDFDHHCSACHQLTYAGQTQQNLPLPHVAHREEYARLLRANLASGAVQARVPKRGDRDGGTRTDPLHDLQVDPGQTSILEARVQAGVDAIFARCGQCHFAQDLTPAAIAQALAGTYKPLIPPRWLMHGGFSHAAHAYVQCSYCHDVPGPMSDRSGPLDETPAGSTQTDGAADDHRRVMIRGPESCVPCHRPAQSQEDPTLDTPEERRLRLGTAQQPVWASDRCTECHRYHWSTPNQRESTP